MLISQYMWWKWRSRVFRALYEKEMIYIYTKQTTIDRRLDEANSFKDTLNEARAPWKIGHEADRIKKKIDREMIIFPKEQSSRC